MFPEDQPYQRRSNIFKPSLKQHTLNQYTTAQTKSKKFSFFINDDDKNLTKNKQSYSYDQPKMNKKISKMNVDHPELQNQHGFTTDFHLFTQQKQKTHNLPQSYYQKQSLLNQLKIDDKYSKNYKRFDPILPKFIFKNFIISQEFKNYTNKQNKMIQELKVNQLNYPFEVDKLMKQTQNQKKELIELQKNQNNIEDEDQKIIKQKNWQKNSYKQSIQQARTNVMNQKKNKTKQRRVKKLPYFPLLGTDGSIYWAHSHQKLILWHYKFSDYYQPQVFCILNFEKQSAPISAVYCTQITNSTFKPQTIILISIAFFNQIKFFTFNLHKYTKQYNFLSENNLQYTQKPFQFYQKYIDHILIKSTSRFPIQKILIHTINSLQPNINKSRPLVIFTDGGNAIQIIDLQKIVAYKSYNPFNISEITNKIFYPYRKEIQNTQEEIMKLLYCTDQNDFKMNFVFVMKKVITIEIKKEKNQKNSILQKFFNIFRKNKEKQQIKEDIVIDVYKWNQNDFNVKKKQCILDTLNNTFYNSHRIKKARTVTSKYLQNLLKQSFSDFLSQNSNNAFSIADISLCQRQCQHQVFSSPNLKPLSSLMHLKISFTNGAYIFISNFKLFNIHDNIHINPYIQKHIPISTCTYKNYRKLLQKQKYIQNSQNIKNKLNSYISQPQYQQKRQKQLKYSPIDPIISQNNGLTICENKIIFQNNISIQYYLTQSIDRKQIHCIKNKNNFSFSQQFIIFQNSHIKLIQSSNYGQNLLILIHLLYKLFSSQSSLSSSSSSSSSSISFKQQKQKIQKYFNQILLSYDEKNKLQILYDLLKLIINIENSGKTEYQQDQKEGYGYDYYNNNKKQQDNLNKQLKWKSAENRQQTNINTRSTKVDFDQTTYFDHRYDENIDNQYKMNEQNRKNKNIKKQQYFVYNIKINKKTYLNLALYVFGSQILQNPYFSTISKPQSSLSPTITITPTQQTLSFIKNIFLSCSLQSTQTSLKPLTLSQKVILSNKITQTIQKQPSLSQNSSFYYNSNIFHTNATKSYLIEIFKNVSFLSETYFQNILSKMIFMELEEILTIKYKDFRKIKCKYIKIIQKLQQIQQFLGNFIKYMSENKQKYQNYSYQYNKNIDITPKNIQNSTTRPQNFPNTLTYCHTITLSIPKIIFLIHIFSILSQILQQNFQLQQKLKKLFQTSNINNDNIIDNQITLKNILFKLQTKQIFIIIIVECLYDDNSLLLDQIETKLPEIEIKYYRNYYGWKKINKNVLEMNQNNQCNDKNMNKLTNNNNNTKNFIINLFTTRTPSSTSYSYPSSFPIQLQPSLSNTSHILQSLSSFTYSQYQKYFSLKQQYYNFINILISKIQYLQQNYNKLNKKYQFSKIQNYRMVNFEEFYKKFVKGNAEKYYQIDGSNFVQIDKINNNYYNHNNEKNNKNIKIKQQQSLKNFFIFQQQAYNYPKFIEISQNIKYFNKKLIQFLCKLLNKYENKLQKQSNSLIYKDQSLKSISQNKTLSHNKKIFIHKKQNQLIQLRKQITKILTLILQQKGSTYLQQKILIILNSNSNLKIFLKPTQIKSTQYMMAHTKQHNKFLSPQQSIKAFYLKSPKNNQQQSSLLSSKQQIKQMYQQRINQQYYKELNQNQIQGNNHNNNNNKWMKKYINNSYSNRMKKQ